LQEARANRVLLVENRRQAPKYLVDKEFLDSLVNERESILATLEILADRKLTTGCWFYPRQLTTTLLPAVC
jgi:hypothetical protein